MHKSTASAERQKSCQCAEEDKDSQRLHNSPTPTDACRNLRQIVRYIHICRAILGDSQIYADSQIPQGECAISYYILGLGPGPGTAVRSRPGVSHSQPAHSVSKAVSQSIPARHSLRSEQRRLPSAHFCSCCRRCRRCCSRSFCVLCIISSNCFNLHNSKQYQNQRPAPTGFVPATLFQLNHFRFQWVFGIWAIWPPSRQ